MTDVWEHNLRAGFAVLAEAPAPAPWPGLEPSNGESESVHLEPMERRRVWLAVVAASAAAIVLAVVLTTRGRDDDARRVDPATQGIETGPPGSAPAGPEVPALPPGDQDAFGIDMRVRTEVVGQQLVIVAAFEPAAAVGDVVATPFAWVETGWAGRWLPTDLRFNAFSSRDRVLCGFERPTSTSSGGGAPVQPGLAGFSMEGHAVTGAPCVAEDFVERLLPEEGHLLALSQYGGPRRLCRRVVSVTDIDPASSQVVCGEFSVDGPAPEIQELDEPCPFPGAPGSYVGLSDRTGGVVGFLAFPSPRPRETDAAGSIPRRPSPRLYAQRVWTETCELVGLNIDGSGFVTRAEAGDPLFDPYLAAIEGSYAVRDELRWTPDQARLASEVNLDGHGDGHWLGRISWPTAPDSDVVEGIGPGLGPQQVGHYATTPFPGESGNSILVLPANRPGSSPLLDLRVGAEIRVELGGKTVRFAVQPASVAPGSVASRPSASAFEPDLNDTGYLGDQGDRRITLVQPSGPRAVVAVAAVALDP